MITRVVGGLRRNFKEILAYCLVGASGVLVNLLVAYACKRLFPLIWPSAQANGVLLSIPGTPYNIRWFMLFSMIAFLVANVSNYQLNRMWTFRGGHHKGWWKEFSSFFIIGLIAQLVGMGVEAALMHPESPINLPDRIFDDSNGWRTKWYWAHLIMIMVTVPLSYLMNRYITFRQARHPAAAPST
ncbi:MAG: GtrA family protein [Propionibacteriaceae bacterium]|jgi:putative flippase GtrA|nr:GtrA family protein [Propionibacteriaceae bacterium]